MTAVQNLGGPNLDFELTWHRRQKYFFSLPRVQHNLCGYHIKKGPVISLINEIQIQGIIDRDFTNDN